MGSASRSHQNRHSVVNPFLRGLWTDSGCLLPTANVPVYQGGYGNDPDWFGRAPGKRPVFHALWLLYGLLISVSGHGQGKGGLYPGRLPAGALLCPGHSDSPGFLGPERYPVRPARGGRALRRRNGVHGRTASQGAGFGAGIGLFEDESKKRPAQNGAGLRLQTELKV